MGRLRIETTECKYKERDRGLKEKFRNDINDQTMTAEIIKGLTTIKEISKIMRERVFVMGKGNRGTSFIEGLLESLNERKDFDIIRCSNCRSEHEQCT